MLHSHSTATSITERRLQWLLRFHARLRRLLSRKWWDNIGTPSRRRLNATSCDGRIFVASIARDIEWIVSIPTRRSASERNSLQHQSTTANICISISCSGSPSSSTAILVEVGLWLNGAKYEL